MKRILNVASSRQCMLAAFGWIEREYTNGLRTSRSCSMSPSNQFIMGKASRSQLSFDWNRCSPAYSRTHHEGTERCSVVDQISHSFGAGGASKSTRTVFPAALLPMLGLLVCCEVKCSSNYRRPAALVELQQCTETHAKHWTRQTMPSG